MLEYAVQVWQSRADRGKIGLHMATSEGVLYRLRSSGKEVRTQRGKTGQDVWTKLELMAAGLLYVVGSRTHIEHFLRSENTHVNIKYHW